MITDTPRPAESGVGFSPLPQRCRLLKSRLAFMNRFRWQGKDPQGNARNERAWAENAQAAKAMLLLEVCRRPLSPH